MTTLHYADPQPGATGYGWATANRELKKALAAHFTLTDGDADIVFTPVTADFTPLSPRRGKVNICLTFFEFPLSAKAKANAEKFDICFVGSTWCQHRCAEAGIHHTAVLIQGVDGAIFSPQPKRKPDGQFRVFSGGKFEFRKGHDLVIAAFRDFARERPDAHLVCAWHNPWPGLINTISASPFIRVPHMEGSQAEIFSVMLTANGVPRDRFTILPQLGHHDLAREMANTDCGLFPNRCEGGNNLVMQEYLSVGRPAAANLKTGQGDIEGDIEPIPATEDAAHWAVQRVSDIVAALEWIRAGKHVTRPAVRWTWEEAAAVVAAEVRRIQPNDTLCREAGQKDAR